MPLLLAFLLASPELERAIQLASASGRVVLLSESDQSRLQQSRFIPIGKPPVLSFRYLEGSQRNRFGDLDLVVDDAGH